VFLPVAGATALGMGEPAFDHQIDPADGAPYKKVYDPRKWLRAGELGLVRRLEQPARRGRGNLTYVNGGGLADAYRSDATPS
jgi:hypothetical protein